MSDKYNQIKETWKIKSILNEAANDWKQSYGCYPTVKEFINLINEYSIAPLNTSNILVEDRLITSNDITWLSKTIINEQSAGMEKIAGFSNNQWEDFLSTIEGTEDPNHPMRIKRAEALKQYPNAMEQRSRAEDPKGWKAKDAAAKKAAAAAEKTARDRSAQEAVKAATAKGRIERVDAPPSAAPPAQEAPKTTATDWKARSNDPAAVRADAAERIRAATARSGNPASSSVPPPSSAKTSFADRLYTAADNTGNKIFTGFQKTGTAAKTVGRGLRYVGKSIAGAIPSVIGQYAGGEAGQLIAGDAGFVPGEIVGTKSFGNFLNKRIESWGGKRFSGWQKAHNLGWGGAAGFVGGSHAADWLRNKYPNMGVAGDIATAMGTMTAGTMAGNMVAKKASQALAPTVAKATAAATKIAPKATKVAGIVGRYLPWLGYAAAGAGIVGGFNRAMGGDLVGGGLQVGSNIVAPIPVVGIPASVAIDGVSAYRDMSPEEREKLHQTGKDSINLPKQVKNVAQGIVPSGLSVPQESEEEKQKRKMLDPDNETVTAPRSLKQSINESDRFLMERNVFKAVARAFDTSAGREATKTILRMLEKEAVKEVPKVLEKEAVRVPFEIPTYTNHPITVAKPLNPISLPTAAPPTITTTNTSVPTGIQTSTTTFPIPKVNVPTTPTKAVPSLPATKTDIPTMPTKAVPTLPATKTDTPTTPAVKTDTKTKTDSAVKTKIDTKTKTDPAIKTKIDTKTDPYRPPPTRIGITTTDKTEEDDSGNNTTALTSVLSDPSLSDFDANTERLHARKGVSMPYWDQGTQSYKYMAQTVQINEDGATGDIRKKQVRRDSDASEESGTEDAAPRLRGTELGARKGVSMPYWDQGTQSYKYMAQTVGLQESRSGTLNTKSALQARAKKQKYKVTVVENGKKLEVFATSIRGIRRVVYGKKNFRVHDGKGADITNYFKRLMSSNKSA